MKLGSLIFDVVCSSPAATLHPRLECAPGFHPGKQDEFIAAYLKISAIKFSWKKFRHCLTAEQAFSGRKFQKEKSWPRLTD